MSELEQKYSRRDVMVHLSRLSATTGDEYQEVRKEWDEKSIGYAWCLIELLDLEQSEHEAYKE